MPTAEEIRAEQYLAPETLVQLAPFELRAKMIIEGVMSGMHRSPYQGMAVEFAEHRQYAVGDDLKHLDWKVFGRTDKLYVKRYQQETNLDVILLVDASASMTFGSMVVPRGWGRTTVGGAGRPWTKYDHAAALSAAIAYICLHQQDRVGLYVFADGLKTILERTSVHDQWRRVVAALSRETAEAATDIVKTTDQVLGRVTNRALFVIVSDFFEAAESVRHSLARFRHQRHDVILLQTLDRQEMRFAFNQAAPFEGMEAEGTLQVEPRALREAFLEAISGHCNTIARAARSFGFDHQLLDTHQSVGPTLAYLLARRDAFLRRSKVG
ncbi:MAG: DUF58 domain-containing protein [Phycisphaerales bacterium]|nr:MAG: DUF58 domain-containing protein [Phycisphaerales bacterium]